MEIQADNFFAAGMFADAVKFYEQCTQAQGTQVQLLVKFGTALAANGNPRKADQIFRRAIAKDPNAFEARLALADLLASYGYWSEAADQLSKLPLDGVSHEPAMRMAVQCFIMSSQADRAEALLLKKVESEPDAESYVTLGYLRQSEGKFKKAQEYFKLALKLDPKNGAAYHGIGQGSCLGEEDRWIANEALKAVESQILGKSDEMAIRYFLGKAFEDEGEFKESSKHFRRANQIAVDLHLTGRRFNIEAHRSEIDSTVAYFNGARIARSDPSHRLQSPSPIFIVGMMRSGTSLLEQILSSHSQVAGGGEIDFWSERHSASFLPERIETLRKDYLAIIEKLAGSANFVTDKMPINYQELGAIHLAFPEAPIIHVRRNPADTCFSIFTTAYSVSPDFAHIPENIVASYREYLRLMEHWRTVLPTGRLLEIDYEDLIQNRHTVLARLLETCGLPWEDAVMSHERNERPVVTPSVWQVRQPLYNSSIGRWRRFAAWFPEFGELEREQPH